MNRPIIAHINGHFFSGSETFIYNYISNHKRFHPICLASRFVNLEQFPFPREDRYSIYARKFGYRWFKRKFLGIDREIEAIIREREVKLLHAHFGPNGVYALTLKKRLGIPLVTTFYGYDVSQLARFRRWQRLYRDLFRGGDLFLVEGPYMKSRLVELGCPEDKIRIQRIAIPVDKIKFRIREPKGLEENVILIFSGRFVEKKGLIYALEAMRQLREMYTNFEFRIIGDGLLKENIIKFVERNNMSDYVRLLGFLPYDQYVQEMQNADISIHPSITAVDGDSEGGAPATILEAQAMGMPVVSTYHADIQNIVVPDRSALLSPERDVNSLRQNIRQLLENQDRWVQMGMVGKDFVYTYHDINKEVVELEDKYYSLLNIN